MPLARGVEHAPLVSTYVTHNHVRYLCVFGLVAALSAVCTARVHAQSLPGARRVAVIVGSNAAPPGRRALRYAPEDARSVGIVLEQLGGFARSDVDVLIEPSPDAVLTTLRRRMHELADAPGDTLLLFHYAGHADAQGLFPSGRLLSYEALRAALAGAGAKVRIGIVDACRGGGWTGTRGLSEAEPFEVSMPMDLENEGTILIASSSGLEDAHESETIQGGFFTHHWVAALRGAAEQSGDGIVSLIEAFDYAKRLTVRDSASMGADPQHPSFHMNLSGRADLPLTRVTASDSMLVIEQSEGPTQLIHIDAGLLVLELPAGPRSARLALIPGTYLVRVRRSTTTLVSEIVLRPHETLTVREDELTSVASSSAVARGTGQRVSAPATPPGVWDLRIAMGIEYSRRTYYEADGTTTENKLQPRLGGLVGASYGFGENAFWQFPFVFGVRLGVAGRTSFVPVFGVTQVYGTSARQINGRDYASFGIEGGVGLRTETPIGPESAFITNTMLEATFDRYERNNALERAYGFRYRFGFALRYSIADRVDLGLGMSVAGYEIVRGGVLSSYSPSLEFGSLFRDNRSVPLVRFHMSRVFSVDLYVTLSRSLEEHEWTNTFLIGTNATWPGRRLRRRLANEP